MKRIILILSWFGIIITGFAQTPIVGIGPIGITGLPDEVYVNQTVSFRVNIQNKGVVDINGWLDVYAGTMQGQQVAIIGAQSVFVDTNLFVSGDTVSVELMFPVDTGAAQLSMGGNTVVVWQQLLAQSLPTLFLNKLILFCLQTPLVLIRIFRRLFLIALHTER